MYVLGHDSRSTPRGGEFFTGMIMGFVTSHRRTAGGLLQVLLFSLLFAMAACGPRAQQREVPSPRPAVPLVQSEVLILPPGQKMQEELEFWTLESQRLVLAYFDIFLRHGFEDWTSSRVTVADDEFEPTTLEFAYQNMGGDNGSEWWAYVPLSGQVEHGGRHPDYVLIFDGLRFNIRSGGGSRQTYDRPGSGRIEVDLEYVLWDNRGQEVAAVGVVHEEAYTSSPNASNEIFKSLFERVAAEVIRNSPLG